MIPQADGSPVALTNANFQTAVDTVGLTIEGGPLPLRAHQWLECSSVTYMADAFKEPTNFNEDIDGWDIKNV